MKTKFFLTAIVSIVGMSSANAYSDRELSQRMSACLSLNSPIASEHGQSAMESVYAQCRYWAVTNQRPAPPPVAEQERVKGMPGMERMAWWQYVITVPVNWFLSD